MANVVKQENLNYISRNVEEVLELYWDGNIPVDIKAIAKALGVNIFYENLDKGIVSLLKVNINNKTVLLINENISEIKKYFTIAHNLGHYFLHINDKKKEIMDGPAIFNYNLKKGSIEWEANIFAQNLLLPEKEFIKEFEKTQEDDLSILLQKAYLSAKFKVFSILIENKLNQEFLKDRISISKPISKIKIC